MWRYRRPLSNNLVRLNRSQLHQGPGIGFLHKDTMGFLIGIKKDVLDIERWGSGEFFVEAAIRQTHQLQMEMRDGLWSCKE